MAHVPCSLHVLHVAHNGHPNQIEADTKHSTKSYSFSPSKRNPSSISYGDQLFSLFRFHKCSLLTPRPTSTFEPPMRFYLLPAFVSNLLSLSLPYLICPFHGTVLTPEWGLAISSLVLHASRITDATIPGAEL